jgi:hypothetical protein
MKVLAYFLLNDMHTGAGVDVLFIYISSFIAVWIFNAYSIFEVEMLDGITVILTEL